MRIAITTGEPSGIGPDIAIMIASQCFDAELVFIADRDLMKERAMLLGCQLPNQINIHHIPLNDEVVPGELNPNNVPYVLNTLNVAADGCLSGEFDAMVTGPVNKAIIGEAGTLFSGQTEYLRDKTNAEHCVMMLTCEKFRVALLTTHIPISSVSENITESNLKNTIKILQKSLMSEFGIENPNILICGLNPHAGEDGYIGFEDKEIIEPVINELNQKGFQLDGPIPADTIFTSKYIDRADAILTMYHDQGLPVLKYAGFGEAVNVTLGLPIIRTSVDHGTALALAGTGTANPRSLQRAIELAINLAKAK